ncbi:hypothetical protein N7470_003346 [Penicillium chermesinum]|nr:hypothetical protein N7470_003346 [Penicillium chermesinum]
MPHEPRGQQLRELVHRLARDSRNPFIIIALMILKYEFTNIPDDDWGLNESRGQACEFVAWQFLCHLNASEARGENLVLGLLAKPKPLLLYPGASSPLPSPALGQRTRLAQNASGSDLDDSEGQGNDVSQYSQFFGLNALEVAAVGHAKKFLSQQVIQRVVNDIWKGEIVFWDSLTVNSKKKPQRFNRKTADPYSRLRVPVYRKMFEAAFFLSFLFLYYSVLLERRENGIGNFEVLMDIWIIAFAYDELSGLVDAGVLFYQMDFWSLWNLGIIGVGLVFIITSK